MIEHYLNGRRVITGREASILKGVKLNTMTQTIKRLIAAGQLTRIPEEDWIDGRTPVYYPEQLGIQEEQ